MAGLVPAIHAAELPLREGQATPSASSEAGDQLPGVDGRDKPGHDAVVCNALFPLA
jgi:hypothetical protein